MIDIPREVFKCCESPSAVTADGIVLSVRSNELNSLKAPWIWKDAPSDAKVRSTRPKDRTLPCTQDEQATMKALLNGTCQHADMMKWLEVGNGVIRSSGPRAAALLALAHHKNAGLVKCPDSLRDFVLCMTKSISPALQLLPSAIWPTVVSCIISPSRPDLTADSLSLLSKHSPFLSRLLVSARDTPQRWRADRCNWFSCASHQGFVSHREAHDVNSI